MPSMKDAENDGAELYNYKKGDWLDLAKVIDGKRVHMDTGPSPLTGESKLVEVDSLEVYTALHSGKTGFKIEQGKTTRDVVVAT